MRKRRNGNVPESSCGNPVCARAPLAWALAEVLKRGDAMRGETLTALNALLKQAGLPPIVVKGEGPDNF